jgi:hypothetical protein
VPSVRGAGGLTVDITTWDVIGLDSNSLTDGPDTFPLGVRVCNTSSAEITGVTSVLTWGTSNANVALVDSATHDLGTLQAGTCNDTYYTVKITRVTAARSSTRVQVVHQEAFQTVELLSRGLSPKTETLPRRFLGREDVTPTSPCVTLPLPISLSAMSTPISSTAAHRQRTSNLKASSHSLAISSRSPASAPRMRHRVRLLAQHHMPTRVPGRTIKRLQTTTSAERAIPTSQPLHTRSETKLSQRIEY